MSDEARIQRFTKDAALTVSKALPAAGAANYTDPIDLGAENPGQLVNNFDALVELPATPALVEAKTVTLTLKDSADGETFAAIDALAAKVSTGASGGGAAAVSHRVKLPTTVRRYIRLDQAVLADGGDNTAVSGSLSLVF
jgi:hypothetical protein